MMSTVLFLMKMIKNFEINKNIYLNEQGNLTNKIPTSIVNQLVTILMSCQKPEQQAEPRHY